MSYRDIMPYIERYNLKHTDTGQILKDALRKGIITEDEGNITWQNMLNKNRKLPAASFIEYINR